MMVLNVFIMIMFLSMLFLGIFYLLSKRKSASKKRVTSKRAISLFGGYTAVLFLAMCVYYVLPQDETAGRDADFNSNEEEMYSEIDEFERLAFEGEIDQIDEKFLIKAQNFRYEGDRMELNIPQLENNPVNVIIKKIEDSADQVEVRYYKAPLRVNGVDISDQIAEEVDIYEEEGRIAISQEMHYDFSFHQFNESFVLSQFNDDSSNRGSGYSFSFRNGTQILYLSIPENVEIDGLEEEFIYYLD
ncbi:hypothetical protein [Jeotgalibacillus proteolyticus]|uniref:Uncharacterized protein n=1 Tax=Jeotgalibacillus proteolyticus TaxID=2082395 RepID=A0A2S5GCK9_9BACL|nr:hypothetical protein [Jeotgalibacillus proteolyticus]PPA70655.1 hypothetical protein C4B60_07600 [Jeotgalibacillus proteolyticus]